MSDGSLAAFRLIVLVAIVHGPSARQDAVVKRCLEVALELRLLIFAFHAPPRKVSYEDSGDCLLDYIERKAKFSTINAEEVSVNITKCDHENDEKKRVAQ